MQLAVIEFARNVLKNKNASSTEFGKTTYPLISLLTEWQTKKGLERKKFEKSIWRDHEIRILRMSLR